MVWMKVPYTNFHSLNQDWIIRRMQEFEDYMQNIVQISVIKYADPIQWRITGQYEQSTVVIDAESGIAYISVQPVPAGVAITNTNYWTPVFDLQQILGDIDQDLADETAARTAADAALQDNIDAEQAARETADATLQENINTEAAALQENIDAEQAAREAADADLLTDIENVRKEMAIGTGRVLPALLRGDILGEGQSAAVLVYGDYCYTFDANNYNGYGNVKKFSISGNNLTDSYYVLVGHANSVMYNEDDQQIYIAPIFTYTAGVSTQTSKIYRYTTDFSSRTELTAPETIQAVTYDHTRKKAYAIARTGESARIYEINNGAFTLAKTLDCSNIWNTGAAQDAAIDDGKLWMNQPERGYIVYDLDNDLQVDQGTVNYMDSNCVWNLGEAEGLEFNETGRLFMMNHFMLTSAAIEDSHNVPVVYSHGIVTEIISTGYVATPTNVKVSLHGTLTCSPTQSTELMNGGSHIKNPMFAICRIEDFGTIQISGGEIIVPQLYVNKSFDIHVAATGTLTLKRSIIVQKDIFGIQTAAGSTLNAPNGSYFIEANDRATFIEVDISGNVTGTSMTASNAIRPGNYRMLVTVGHLTNVDQTRIGCNGKYIPQFSAAFAGSVVQFVA